MTNVTLGQSAATPWVRRTHVTNVTPGQRVTQGGAPRLRRCALPWADLLGPFGAKPWFDFLGGEEAIVVIVSYNAPKP